MPSTLLALAATAAANGELAEMWNFSDVPSFGALETFEARSRKEAKEAKAAKKR